jgi:hypothetical protein
MFTIITFFSIESLVGCDVAFADSGLAKCVVSDGGVPPGSVTLQVPVLEGFRFEATKKGCNQFLNDKPEKSPLVVHLFAVTSRDAGPEQLLNQEPDGALLWLKKIAGADTKHLSDGTIEIAGKNHRYYQVLGRPPGADQIREIVVMRVRKQKHNIVFLATFEPEKSGIWLKKSLEVFKGTRILQIQMDRNGKGPLQTVEKVRTPSSQ